MQAGLLTLESAGGDTCCRQLSVWDHLQQQLQQLKIGNAAAAAQELPFEFWGGFVGFLGYELKAECGGQPAHTAPTPDAAMFLADRCALVMHLRSWCCHPGVRTIWLLTIPEVVPSCPHSQEQLFRTIHCFACNDVRSYCLLLMALFCSESVSACRFIATDKQQDDMYVVTLVDCSQQHQVADAEAWLAHTHGQLAAMARTHRQHGPSAASSDNSYEAGAGPVTPCAPETALKPQGRLSAGPCSDAAGDGVHEAPGTPSRPQRPALAVLQPNQHHHRLVLAHTAPEQLPEGCPGELVKPVRMQAAMLPATQQQPGMCAPARPATAPIAAATQTQQLAGPTPPFSLRTPAEQYLKDISACRRALQAGQSYELCLTNAFVRRHPVDAFQLYLTLRKLNPAPYAAWLSFPADNLRVSLGITSQPACSQTGHRRFGFYSKRGFMGSLPADGRHKGAVVSLECCWLMEL